MNRILATLAAFTLIAVPVSAQRLNGGAGVSFETYSFSEPSAVGIQSITLLTTPIGARAMVSSWLSLEALTAYASGTLKRADGSESTLSSMTDTDVRAVVSLLRNRVSLSATYTIPTGKSKQTAEETDVAGAIAADLLPFRISNWGAGGGVGIDASMATTAGPFGIGLNVGYGVTREFEPLAEDERAYLPGSPLHARVAVDRDIGSAGKLSLLFSMQHFSNDELAGQNLYRSGDRFQGMVSYGFAAGARSNAVLYGGWLRRQRGTYLDPALLNSSEGTPAQDLILGGGGLRMSMGSIVVLPNVDARIFRSADGQDQGYALGVGIGSEIGRSNFILLPTVRARFGNVLVSQGVESSFTGIEAGFTIRFGNALR